MEYEEEIKELSQKISSRNKKVIIIMIIVFVIMMIPVLMLNIFSLILFTLFFNFIIGFLISSSINKADNLRIANLYKENIVKSVLYDNFNNVVLYDYGIDKDSLKETNMIDTRDIFNSNDLLTGEYKNVPFKMSDIEIVEEETDSDGDTTYNTVFKGQYVVFDCKKKFKTNIEIISKNFGVAIVCKNYNSVKFEDVDFNKKFYVYSLKELDAFYLVTPLFMEKIKAINEKYGSIMLFFLDNKMHILIDSYKDLFNIYNIKDFNSSDEKKRIEEEIDFIKDIVNSLDLGVD